MSSTTEYVPLRRRLGSSRSNRELAIMEEMKNKDNIKNKRMGLRMVWISGLIYRSKLLKRRKNTKMGSLQVTLLRKSKAKPIKVKTEFKIRIRTRIIPREGTRVVPKIDISTYTNISIKTNTKIRTAYRVSFSISSLYLKPSWVL